MIVTCKSRCEKGGQILDVRKPVNAQFAKRFGVVGLWKSFGSGGNILRDLMRKGDGTLIADARHCSPHARPGGYGATLLDGTGDYVSIADREELQYTSTSPKTVLVWFNPATVSGVHTVISKWQLAGGTREWILYANGATLTLGVNNEAAEVSATISANRWWHVAFTLNTSGGSELFLDGVSKGTGSATTFQTVRTGIVAIGQDAGADFFNGKVDSLLMCNRVLTVSQRNFLRHDDMQGNPRLLNWIEDSPYVPSGRVFGGATMTGGMYVNQCGGMVA